MSKGWVKLVISLIIFFLGVALAGMVDVLTLGRHPDFCRRRIVRPLVLLILRLHGIELDLPANLGRISPAFYLFNHHSNLDVHIITALDIPNLRSFFSNKKRSHFLAMQVARAMGAFLLPPQWEHEERVACFRRAESELRRTGESMIAAPEGTRCMGGQMGPFNKGVFHLAIRLGLPIVPLYFDIPEEAEARTGYFFRPAKVRVRELATVETRNLPESAVTEVRDQVWRSYDQVLKSSGSQNRNSISITVADKKARFVRFREMLTR